jgi:hypothetical protein
MKHANWLVKLLFYLHDEEEVMLTRDSHGIFYEVGYVYQEHANLCTNASESMMNHFFKKPFASMFDNPRGLLEGSAPNRDDYTISSIKPDDIKSCLEKHGPFIMLMPLRWGFAHSIVVTGCTEDFVIYNDPLTGGHRMIAKQKLSELCLVSIEEVEIATMKHINEKYIQSVRKDTLPNPPEDIMPSTYQGFFSINKMLNPKEAVLGFLEDYAEFSLFNLGRHHKAQVKNFIEQNRNNSLEEIILNLNRSFPKDNINPNGELMRRVLTIEKMMNKEHSAPLKKR